MPDGVTVTVLVRVDDLHAWAATHNLGHLADEALVREVEDRVIRSLNGNELRVTEIGHTRWRTP